VQRIARTVSPKYQDIVPHERTMNGQDLLILTRLKIAPYCKADSTGLVAIPKNGFVNTVMNIQ
jgi:hypothetical protein